jgi:hypothetical protein
VTPFWEVAGGALALVVWCSRRRVASRVRGGDRSQFLTRWAGRRRGRFRITVEHSETLDVASARLVLYYVVLVGSN